MLFQLKTCLTFIVDDDESLNTFLALDPLQSFFHFSLKQEILSFNPNNQLKPQEQELYGFKSRSGCLTTPEQLRAVSIKAKPFHKKP